jgi:hypothetical protein
VGPHKEDFGKGNAYEHITAEFDRRPQGGCANVAPGFRPGPSWDGCAAACAAVVLERFVGPQLADLLGLPKVPVLFGFLTILLASPR